MLLCQLACMRCGLVSPTPRMHCAWSAQPPNPMLRCACLVAPALCAVPTFGTQCMRLTMARHHGLPHCC